ncbi:MAG: hypothetical protein Q7J06_11070 [Bacteroidales bacterium]|nr:hypothetical protein [Bacteroidales bacterium]
MSTENEKTEVPIVQEEFANFLKKYKVAKGGEMCGTIAENIAETGGADVFETPEAVAKGLGTWSEYIGAPLRKQILQHWFAKKRIEVPPEAIEAAGLTAKTEATMKNKKEIDKKKAEGALWTIDIDDSGTPRIRMIKDVTEPGVTLAEAKAAAKEIGKEREEPIVIYNEELSRHMPNFKSSFVKQNLSAAWATARQMDRAIAEGEPLDPMDVWIEQQAKLAQFREVMDLTPETKGKGTMGEIVTALKDLKAMADEGKVSGVPGWMTDPIEFINTVKTITTPETKGEGTMGEIVTALKDLKAMADEGKVSGVPGWMSNPVEFINTVRGVSGAGEGKSLPDWMSDPAKFLETVERISGGGKGDESLKQQVASLEQTLIVMREDRYKEQIESQKQQMGVLATKVGELTDRVADLGKPSTGRTEMDILHEIASEGLGVLKTELPGFRRDLKDAIGSTMLPPGKSAEERKERTSKLRQSVERDKNIEEIGRRLFFSEG